MAKELPYFQFEPAEYLTKDISFCSLSAQGLFINICAYYWQRNCVLTKKQLLRRLFYEVELNELIDEGVIDFDGENISIKFLDAQLTSAIENSTKNRVNGSKGGAPKGNKNATKQPKNNPKTTQKQGIREDKIKEDEIKEDNIISIYPDFEDFWELYDKKVGDKNKLEAKWNKLSQKTKEEIIVYIPNYKISQPDKQFRKNPTTFLNNESWKDELIIKTKSNGIETTNKLRELSKAIRESERLQNI